MDISNEPVEPAQKVFRLNTLLALMYSLCCDKKGAQSIPFGSDPEVFRLSIYRTPFILHPNVFAPICVAAGNSGNGGVGLLFLQLTIARKAQHKMRYFIGNKFRALLKSDIKSAIGNMHYFTGIICAIKPKSAGNNDTVEKGNGNSALVD